MTNLKTKGLRIFCFLLAVLMLSTALVSCGKDGNEEQTKPKKTINNMENAPVPHYDWGGRIFKVLSVHNENQDSFEIVGQSDGDIVQKEVFNRNSEIAEYYNLKIVDVGSQGDANYTLLENSITSKTSDYDLIFLFRNDMAKAIMSGFMTELSGLPYMDTSKDWYNSDTIQSMKIGNSLYHMVSDFSLVDKARTNMLFFNRDMAEDKQLPDIIQKVRDKQWVIDDMITYAAQAAENVDGNEIRDLNDNWGLVCGGTETVSVFWNALGNKLVTVDSNGEWAVEVTSERSQKSIEKLRLLYDKDNTFYGNMMGDYSDSTNTFVAEKALFMSAILDGITGLGTNAEFSYSAIPYPMLDVDQGRYYTTNDNVYCATFGIPASAAEPDFSAFMIEVLSWRSSTTTYPTYYETLCKVRKSYDETCAEMVDLVVEGLVFDFGMLYGSQIHKIKSEVLQKSIYSTQDVTSLYDGEKGNIESNIGKIFTAIENFSQF